MRVRGKTGQERKGKIMLTEKTIEAAKSIRHRASLKWGYPISAIDWASCLGMAMRGEALPWESAAQTQVVIVQVPAAAQAQEKVYEFEKVSPNAGINFLVRIVVPAQPVDKNGEFSVKWNLPGRHETVCFARLVDDTIKFYCVETIPGLGKVGAIRLPAEILSQLQADKTAALASWEKGRQALVDAVAAGTIPLDVHVVGCDYPEYQAWVEVPVHGPYNVETYQAQDIMRRAAEKSCLAAGIPEPTDDICGWLAAEFGKSPRTAAELPTYATPREVSEDEKNRRGSNVRNDACLAWTCKLGDVIAAVKVRLAKRAADKAAWRQANPDKAAKADFIAAQEKKGLGQCWECGCWVPLARLDESGYCGC
jgi:hypothetical protein